MALDSWRHKLEHYGMSVIILIPIVLELRAEFFERQQDLFTSELQHSVNPNEEN